MSPIVNIDADYFLPFSFFSPLFGCFPFFFNFPFC